MRNEKGFTIIELLVVVMFIGILAVIGLSGVVKWQQTAVVQVAGQTVFRGHASCVEVRSAGAATSVDIGPPCVWPGRHYTDKDVRVTVE